MTARLLARGIALFPKGITLSAGNPVVPQGDRYLPRRRVTLCFQLK
ncbi:MAG: hypothetical protein ACK5Q5_17390 [Planctomycetaceae bacterium]